MNTPIDNATKRPWVVTNPIEEKSSGYLITSPGNESVCQMTGKAWYGENEPRAVRNKANATLIVQAVNEYEALCEIAEASRIALDEVSDGHGLSQLNGGRLHKALSKLNAIRK